MRSGHPVGVVDVQLECEVNHGSRMPRVRAVRSHACAFVCGGRMPADCASPLHFVVGHEERSQRFSRLEGRIPMATSEGPNSFSQAHRAGLETRRDDQDRTLAAMHRLEAALESAGPGREASWQDEVMGGLSVLDAAITEESDNASRADSLLSDIARTQPLLRNRVRGTRMQYQQLRDRVSALRRELEEADSMPDVADLRERLASVLHGLRHQRARESDLIYEAYYEAFRAELDQ